MTDIDLNFISIYNYSYINPETFFSRWQEINEFLQNSDCDEKYKNEFRDELKIIGGIPFIKFRGVSEETEKLWKILKEIILSKGYKSYDEPAKLWYLRIKEYCYQSMSGTDIAHHMTWICKSTQSKDIFGMDYCPHHWKISTENSDKISVNFIEFISFLVSGIDINISEDMYPTIWGN